MNKIELSIKQVIKSALVNLAEKYADNLDYASALYEISDYYQVKEVALAKVPDIFSSVQMNFRSIKSFNSYCWISHYIRFFNSIYFFPFKLFNNFTYK